MLGRSLPPVAKPNLNKCIFQTVRNLLFLHLCPLTLPSLKAKAINSYWQREVIITTLTTTNQHLRFPIIWYLLHGEVVGGNHKCHMVRLCHMWHVHVSALYVVLATKLLIVWSFWISFFFGFFLWAAYAENGSHAILLSIFACKVARSVVKFVCSCCEVQIIWLWQCCSFK